MITVLYPWVLYYGLPLIILTSWLSARYRRVATYQFPLTHLFNKSLQTKAQPRMTWHKALFVIRTLIALTLLLIIARPQSPDERSKTMVEGVATMLVLDVSGSMESFDDLHTRKTRFTIAQEEAIKFINRRGNDLLGLVIFGALAASRCPLTADKRILTDIIRDTKIGVLNPDGTMLSMAIALGVGRLRNCSCSSKIMVVLTDGEPSQGDMNPQMAVDLAKKAGIKIYTIGIGSSAGGFLQHPLGGIVQMPTPLNENLLRAIAGETGGMFFHASDQKDLERIYAQIDTLEKSSHETPVYSNYYECYLPLLLFVFLLLAFEIVITAYIWVVI